MKNLSTLLIVFLVDASCSRASQIELDIQRLCLDSNFLKDVRGTSLHWSEDGDGLRLSESGTVMNYNDSLIQSLGYNVLRIPGGYLTRWFDWEDAVGENRKSQKDFQGNQQQVKAGLMEMKRFAYKHHMEVLYTLTITDPPEKLSRLIKVWNELPPKDGPVISWFELGNENYDTDPSVAGAEKYVRTVEPLIRVIRKESPASKIGIIVANPVVPSWDTTVFSRLKDRMDMIMWHRYVPYTSYTDPNSHPATISAFQEVENELRYLYRITDQTKPSVSLTEYNLSYYSTKKVHQNVVLEPKYNLLLGNFVTLAYRNHLSGMVKHCLANSKYHIFADINFAGKEKGLISISGMVSREFNRWISTQDSVAVFVHEPQYSPWEFSILCGKSPKGRSFVIQNHTAHPVEVKMLYSGLNVAVSVKTLVQHNKTLWTDRKDRMDLTKKIVAQPYSLMFMYCY